MNDCQTELSKLLLSLNVEDTYCCIGCMNWADVTRVVRRLSAIREGGSQGNDRAGRSQEVGGGDTYHLISHGSHAILDLTVRYLPHISVD